QRSQPPEHFLTLPPGRGGRSEHQQAFPARWPPWFPGIRASIRPFRLVRGCNLPQLRRRTTAAMRTFIARFPVLSFVVLTLVYQFLVVGVVWWRLPEGGHMHDDATAHMVFRFRVFGPLVFAVLL